MIVITVGRDDNGILFQTTKPHYSNVSSKDDDYNSLELNKRL